MAVKKKAKKKQAATWTVKECLSRLELRGDEKVRAHYKKRGAGDNQFGVKLGDIRKLAKEMKTQHELGLELWQTGNIDAQFLAILVMKPKSLTLEQLDDMLGSVEFDRVADWLNSYLVKKHPKSDERREQWMDSDKGMVARAGWNLTSIRVEKSPEGLDIGQLLDRIESEAPNAPPEAQWTMNFVLANIGIHHADHRERAIAIGEALGLYRDFPVSKGCTSPFAPIWIEEMVKRQKA